MRGSFCPPWSFPNSWQMFLEQSPSFLTCVHFKNVIYILTSSTLLGFPHQILKEEVHDLLDPNPPHAELQCGAGTAGLAFGGGLKTGPVIKPPIQIRETSNGGITLAGVTETEVNTLGEMAACLERGSLCRATGSTNMNSSSRYIAIENPYSKRSAVISPAIQPTLNISTWCI